MASERLNDRAIRLVERMRDAADELRVKPFRLPGGGHVIDCGVDVRGSLEAGRQLAEICMSGLGTASLVDGTIGDVGWPHVFVATDHPVEACLLSQYAGWEVRVDEYFAMGSGPMRAAAAREELFKTLSYGEKSDVCVGVLESAELPGDAVVAALSERAGVAADRTVLLTAPTSSVAGNLQIVARSVETALHKLFELEFDVSRIQSACGTAPLSPVATDDLTGIGRTNDAILYGGRVTVWVVGDDEAIARLGPQVPAGSCPDHGKPFLDIFEDAGRDFYKIDPHLFSPAEIVFQNLDTGRVHRFGEPRTDVLLRSFDL